MASVIDPITGLSTTSYERILNTDDTLNRSAYIGIASTYNDPETIDYRLGPGYEDFHQDDSEKFPTVYTRNKGGNYNYGNQNSDVRDYTGKAGQILYVPEEADDPGVDRARFSWSSHGGHGGSEYWHRYALKPIGTNIDDGFSHFVKSPDPSIQQASWSAASEEAQLNRPIAVGRAHVSWSNTGIMIFQNGLIGASGYGNNEDKYPYTKLPAHKVPTAVAVTNNNEFALVTLWDTKALKGQVAVVALEARALEHHSWRYAGLPNVGTYTRLKILGYVDLPGIAAPTGISASSDVNRWDWMSKNNVNQERLDTQSTRDKWHNSVDDDHKAASAGFAVVTSRSENKAAFIDLEPLFEYYRKMYFTTQENFNQTKKEGTAPNQWPFNFDVAPEAKPQVSEVIDVERPTAVATGFSRSGMHSKMNDPNFGSKAFITTMDGELLVYDVGGLATTAAADKPKLIDTIAVGYNPTDIAYGRDQGTKDELAIVSRGDRKVNFVDPATGSVTRTLQDSRLQDPVAVISATTRGANVLSVADFAGGQVANYLKDPIGSWGDKLFGGLGANGNAAFEFTDSLNLPGQPFMLSAAEVN